MDSSVFILIMDLIGTVAFAVSGAMVAIRKEMDIFGVNILAVVTATGGGVVRDLLIGHTPPAMFENPLYVLISAVVANIVFIFVMMKHSHNRVLPVKFVHLYEKALFWADALGLAAFTVDGVHAGQYVKSAHPVFLVVFLGVITGVGGGVLRDVFAAQMPYIFVKHVYAVASLTGALVMAVTCMRIGWETPAIMIGFTTVLVLRVLAYHFQWNLPRIHCNRLT